MATRDTTPFEVDSLETDGSLVNYIERKYVEKFLAILDREKSEAARTGSRGICPDILYLALLIGVAILRFKN